MTSSPTPRSVDPSAPTVGADAIRSTLDAEEARLRALIATMETGGVISHTGTDEHLVPMEDRTNDGGTELAERTLQLGLLDSIEAQIAEVGVARQRVDLGTYGICEHCGQAINPERLSVQPLSRTCTEHAA